MNQCRRPQSLAKFLVREFGGSEFANFVIHQRQKLLCRVGVARFDLR